MNKAEMYLQSVMDGRETVGRYIKKAVQKHFDELQKTDWQYYFDPRLAEGAINAIEVQRLAMGRMAGEPFVLMPWQAAIIWIAYGWRRKPDGKRRFTKCYIKVARGNAKTEFLAAVGNLGFFFEGEKDPQIIWAATKKDQARIGFSRQKKMAEYLIGDYESFARDVGTSQYRIFEHRALGYVGYLGSESKTEDGLSPYYGLIDEYHAHPSDDMVHVIESGMVKRERPFLWMITTAGHNPDGPCGQFEKRAKMMLDGGLHNDELLAFIYDMDEGDDWQDETVWKKPNPSMGVSLTIDSLRSEYKKAISEGVAKENDFKTKNLNVWVSSRAQWISDEKFKGAGGVINESELEGRACFGGLDLSKNRDITALCLFFPAIDEGERHKVVFRFWCPEDNAVERSRTDGVPYLDWARAGYLRLTPGDVVRREYIRTDILELKKRFKIHSIAYDRWNALEMVADIKEEVGDGHATQTGEWMEGFTQTTSHMHAPITELEGMILSGKLNHGSNPVIEWMNRNVVIFFDSNGNVKFDKGKAVERIDGMVAMAMACGQYMTYKHSVVDAYSPDVDIIVL